MRLYDFLQIDVDPQFIGNKIRGMYVFNTRNPANHVISHAFEFGGRLQIGIETAGGLFNLKNLIDNKDMWEIEERYVIIKIFEE